MNFCPECGKPVKPFPILMLQEILLNMKEKRSKYQAK